MVILKKFVTRVDKDGKPIAHRTAYYKAYDSEKCKPIMGSRALAANLMPEYAQTTLNQLSQLHGGGFELAP